MWYDNLFQELEQNRDDMQGVKMSAYMKNNFEFLGIPKPRLTEIIKPYLKESRRYEFDWGFIDLCWRKAYREAQYVAINYLDMNTKKLTVDDLPKLKALIINKSWWDTVDSLDAMVGSLVLKNEDLKATMLEWSTSDNLWLRRVSINFQQEFKEKTNTGLLEKIIINNLGSSEFFINKAIGWSLRDYSKINPVWVSNFLADHKEQLSSLSIKEAGKYLKLRRHVHIFGASGSGTTTIAKEIGKAIGYRHFDSDNYFWLPTEEPFTAERDRAECISLLQADLNTNVPWILSGSVVGWGEALLPLFDLVVFVYVPQELRMERLKKREEERYGSRILPGGDRYQASVDFIDWAASYDSGTKTGRSLQKHEAWLSAVTCPVIRVTNINLEDSITEVINAINNME
jgi:3-methyladenine DNA glycosylase AlkD